MNIVLQFCVFTLIAQAVDSFERVARAAGKNCPKDFDFQKGMSCGKKRCIRFRKNGTKVTFKCPRGFGRYGKRSLLCRQDNTWNGDPPICVKSGCAPIDTSDDINLVMSLHPKFDDAVITFQCEDDYLMFGQPEIHCNGVQWSSAPPRCEAIADLMACDFEKDLCGWTHNRTLYGNHTWTRHMGATSTGGTGPKRDHTYPNLNTGHYLFFEASSPTEEGDTATLISPPYTEDFSPMCFEFWYHMLGPNDHGHVGSLAVYVIRESEPSGPYYVSIPYDVQPSFYKEGNQGDMWHRGDIFIDEMLESYQIIIQATRLKSYMSDIAIDDVRLYNCTQTTSSSTTSSTTSAVPTGLSTSAYSGRFIEPSSVTSTASVAVRNSSIQVQTSVLASSRLPKNGTSSMTISTNPFTNITRMVSTKQTEAVTTSSSTMSSITSRINPSPLPTTTVPTSSKLVSSRLNKTMIPTVKTEISTILSKATTTAGSKASSTVKPSKNLSVMTFPTTETPVKTTAATSKTAKLSTKQTSILVTTPVSTLSTTPSTQLTKRRIPTTTTMPLTTQTLSQTNTPVTKAPATSRKEITVRSSSTTVKSSVTTRLPLTQAPSSKASTENTLSSRSTTTLYFITSPLPTKSNLAGSSTKFIGVSSTSNSEGSSITHSTTNSVTSFPTALTSSGGNSSISVSQQRSKHPEDETLKPLMIGLGVGIIVGLIVIGVIGWVCMRRRKFYTSRYEDELKPITNAASTQSLNNDDYYQDDFDIEHVQ